MSLNRIDRAVADARNDLEVARLRKDKRKEGEALAKLNAALHRQMKRDKRAKSGQFAPEAVEAARSLPRYDGAARRSMRKAFAAIRLGAQVGLFALYMAGVGGMTLGAQLIIGA